MDSPADPGVTSSSAPAPMHTNGSPSIVEQPGLQPVSSAPDGVPAFSHIPASMQQTFVMAQPGSGAAADQAQLVMQPPMSLPLMMPSYQMILPTQGQLVDQQGQLITDPRGSPATTAHGSRSTTPQQQMATALYQQQQLIQIKDNAKTDRDTVASPVRQGSVGSGGSPAPPTPGSLGSPLPTILPDGSMQQQFPQQQQLTMGLPLSLAGLPSDQQPAVQTPPPEPKEEKIDISKLKPPKKPLTPYMRFSKSIWQQVKAANSSMSVCEIGATIGRMWRELADTEKQKYNEDFANDKISYDVELQNFLKITGLQASDLVKSRTKKKGGGNRSAESKAKSAASQQAAQAAPAASPQPQPQQMVQQLPGGQQVIGLPVNGPGSQQQVALSNLPHFSQVWTGQQGATILSQPEGQHQQMVVQQNAQGQQVVINTLGLPAGTVVNGSTAGGGELSGAPILIQPTGDQATQLFSSIISASLVMLICADGQPAQDLSKMDTSDTATSQAATAATPQVATLGWQQVMAANPGDLQHQQNVLNLINMAAQTGMQPDQLTQAAQIAGLPLGIQQVSVAATTSDGTDANAPTTASAAPRTEQTVLVDQNGTPVQNGPQHSSVVTVPTAHNLYNSYGFNPWSAFPQQLVQTAADGTTTAATTATQDGIQVVYNRESILETELQHLRSALSEKTKEVTKLTQDLEKAYSIIEQLKQQNPTAVIHLPAPLDGQPPGIIESSVAATTAATTATTQ